MLAICTALYFLLVNGQAHTRIDTQGIHYKYFPFVRNWRTIAWEEITKVEIKSINPIGDYGGYGYRWGRKGKGIVLAGDRAILIHLKTGKNFVLTTENEQGALRELQHYAPDILSHG